MQPEPARPPLVSPSSMNTSSSLSIDGATPDSSTLLPMTSPNMKRTFSAPEVSSKGDSPPPMARAASALSARVSPFVSTNTTAVIGPNSIPCSERRVYSRNRLLELHPLVRNLPSLTVQDVVDEVFCSSPASSIVAIDQPILSSSNASPLSSPFQVRQMN